MKKKNTAIKQAKGNYIFIAIISIYAVINAALLLIPLIWVLIESFNDYYSYILNPFSLPSPESFSELFANYKVAWSNLNFVKTTLNGKVLYTPYVMLFNSFIMATFPTAFAIFINICVAYVISKYKHWKISSILLSLIVFFMVFPGVGSLGAQLQLYKALGLYDNWFHLFVGISGLNTTTLIIANAFSALPNDYRDAASIDGAGQYTIMFKVYLPMVLPTAIAFFVVNFMGNWNNYEISVVWMPSYPNIAYGMYQYQLTATKKGASVPEILAGFIMVSIPSVLLWTLSQKKIMAKMVMGGLKG